MQDPALASADAATPLVAGVSSAAIAIVLAVLIGLVVMRRRQLAKENAPYDFAAAMARLQERGLIIEDRENLSRSREPREIKRAKVFLLEKLGSGAFGDVMKAELDESDTGTPA